MARMFKPPRGMRIECIGISEDGKAIVYNLRFIRWHPATWLVIAKTMFGKLPDCELRECP